VEKNTHRLLDLFDSANLKQAQALRDVGSKLRSGPVKATFFVLGWVAERLPHLVREINARGHEVASHGYFHQLCPRCSWEDLESDLKDSKKLLEDMTGRPVHGYRAPGFSVSDRVLRAVENAGYLYDSSFNSFGMNHRYGRLDLNGKRTNRVAIFISDSFYEIPVSNLELGNRILPWGGGGYFRLIPHALFRYGVKRILSRQNVYVFYIHPWEIDPEQPRVEKVNRILLFRHYVNLDKTFSRLLNFLDNFRACRFLGCHQYLQNLMTEHPVTDAVDARPAKILPFPSPVSSDLPVLAKKAF